MLNLVAGSGREEKAEEVRKGLIAFWLIVILLTQAKFQLRADRVGILVSILFVYLGYMDVQKPQEIEDGSVAQGFSQHSLPGF